MSNIVIASTNSLCQNAKNWFIKNQGYKEGPPLDSLEDTERLLIIAHDAELGDASAFLKALDGYDFPMAEFEIVLIVCSAASLKFGKDLLSPAERIANHFKRDVHAAKGIVNGQWNPQYASFVGDYLVVTPNTDITSLMQKLSLK